MRKVFVSSVVTGYEDRRQAARKAIELMGFDAIMAEDFGARPFSPEVACLTEVSQCDVYLVILGQRYGFETPDGVSVTQAEFRRAIRSQRPVLALIENTEMEPDQQKFREEVESYAKGFYRDTFSSSDDAKDKIIIALRQLDQSYGSATVDEFEQRLQSAIESVGFGTARHSQQSPSLICAWWPQPILDFDIDAAERESDHYFDKICSAGLAQKRHGYEPISGVDYTGLSVGRHAAYFFDDGLLIFSGDPTCENHDAMMSSLFVPPSRVRTLALAAASLFQESGAWCQLRLQGMEHKKFAEPPQDSRGPITMPMLGDDSAKCNQKFIPYTLAQYSQWLERALARFERTFTSRS